MSDRTAARDIPGLLVQHGKGTEAGAHKENINFGDGLVVCHSCWGHLRVRMLLG